MRASPSGKASAFQADIRGFESRCPLNLDPKGSFCFNIRESPQGAMSRCPLSKRLERVFLFIYSRVPSPGGCFAKVWYSNALRALCPAARSNLQNPARDFLFNLFEPPKGAMSRCPLNLDPKGSFCFNIRGSPLPSGCYARG
jgi:hypothetical protein